MLSAVGGLLYLRDGDDPVPFLAVVVLGVIGEHLLYPLGFILGEYRLL